jgi:MerR family mercuric resistance operon transcriptional regulator
MQPLTPNSGMLTIGGLAREVGVGVETIRYYHRLGLLQEPPKHGNARRRYPPEVALRLRFIRRAQTLGFTLREIGELLSLGTAHCDTTRSLAERKLLAIEERLAELEAAHRSLRALIRYCKGDQGDHCGLFAALLEPPPRHKR